jgi:hypothetical protein
MSLKRHQVTFRQHCTVYQCDTWTMRVLLERSPTSMPIRRRKLARHLRWPVRTSRPSVTLALVVGSSDEGQICAPIDNPLTPKWCGRATPMRSGGSFPGKGSGPRLGPLVPAAQKSRGGRTVPTLHPPQHGVCAIAGGSRADDRGVLCVGRFLPPWIGPPTPNTGGSELGQNAISRGGEHFPQRIFNGRSVMKGSSVKSRPQGVAGDWIEPSTSMSMCECGGKFFDMVIWCGLGSHFCNRSGRPTSSVILRRQNDTE